jgi:undecaprenyl-diphosphatase
MVAMDYLQAVILAAVQGVTEWLPVSSSGHLVLFQKMMGLDVPVAFDVLLHLGTLAAVVVFLWKDLMGLARSAAKGDYRLAAYIVLATIPAGLAGVLLKKHIEAVFNNLFALTVSFLFTGILLLATKKAGGSRQLDAKSASYVGLMQAVSILPGVSRSGSTISAGLLLGLGRQEAARFSFLLSVPVILGAAFVEAKGLANPGLDPGILCVSVAVSAIVGYISLKLVWRTITDDKFHLFGYYCVGLSLVLALLQVSSFN